MDANVFLQSIRLKGIQIRLASPNNIRRWAERKLPNGKIIGQVTSSQTVNYQK
jgi:DNA-directed RNA polymerase subunit beta'